MGVCEIWCGLRTEGHLLSSLTSSGGSYSKLQHGDTFTVCSNINSLLIDEDLCEIRNVSIKLPCALLVHLCLSSGDLFVFSVRFSYFYSYFCYLYFGTFLFYVFSFLEENYLSNADGITFYILTN